VGKTRLAQEVAAGLANEFPDGVWVFELAAVADPGPVPDAVAAVLGIIQQPGKSVSESVAAALEGRIRLLVFDNCEHVLDAAAGLVEAILAHSATVKILATSREGLRVADEQLWPVPSLDVGAGIDSAAVSLFIERAQAVSPRFSVTNADEAAAVVEICRRLDGIPLAIELAASRLVSMTASEVRDRLDQRFRLLVGSRRGLERHHTLRHAVAWSYNLLDDAEKALLERCSVFAGGFDLESACAVMGSDDDFANLDLLDALVRKSLLVADRSSGRTRFSMLETIRQFAEEQLVARGEASEVRAAHSRYSPDAKPTLWPCGTAPGSGRPTTGSRPSWPTCAPRFGGPPTTPTSTLPPPSPPTRRTSAIWSIIMSRSPGPRSSSSPPAPSTTPGSRPCTCWRRGAGSWDGSRRLLAMPTPVRR
jgi:predicted ATPase